MVASSSLRALPRDLLTEEIFLRLPTKSLLQCKSVCKEWYGIISSPSFIDMHFHHPTNHTRLLLYYNRYKHPWGIEPLTSYSYFPDVETCERHQVPDHLVLWGEITFLRGPCNGIFCIHIRENRFALWNPTTRRFRPILCSPSHKFDEVGFGVDPLTGDFKIVLIRSLFCISPCFAIYTSSNHSWRYLEHDSLGDPCACIKTRTSESNTFLNGTYYWMIHNQSKNCLAVLAFDMHNEIFQQIETPETIGGMAGGLLYLFNDSLALVSFKGKHTEIWLLEGNGYWTKFLYVVLPSDIPLPIGFWGGNKVLLEIPGDHEYELLMYDLDSHSAKLLNVERGHDERVRVNLPIHYKESLASVKGEHGIEDYDTRSVEGLKFLGYQGRYTEIGCDAHREDAQRGTEVEEYMRYEEEYLRYDDYMRLRGMEEDWRDPCAEYHPYLDSEGNPRQPEMEEDWRNDTYAEYHPYLDSEGNPRQPEMEEDWRNDTHAEYHPYLDSEGNPRQPEMEEDWRNDTHAEYHPYLDSEGNPRQP